MKNIVKRIRLRAIWLNTMIGIELICLKTVLLSVFGVIIYLLYGEKSTEKLLENIDEFSSKIDAAVNWHNARVDWICRDENDGSFYKI